MDSSFWSLMLSTLIGAVIALVASILTAKKTHDNNSKLEECKLIRTKKEELFIMCELVKRSFADNEMTIIYVVSYGKRPTSKEKFDIYKPHPFHTVDMLINLYFPSLKPDLLYISQKSSEFHKYYSKYVDPSEFLSYSNDQKNEYIKESHEIAETIYDRIKKIQKKLQEKD